MDINKKLIKKIIKRYRRRYTKHRYSPLIFAILGSLFLIFAFVWRMSILPDMMVIPDGMEMKIELYGEARIINETNGEFSDNNIKAILATEFGKSRGDNIEVTQTLQFVNTDTGEDLLAKYEGLMESSRTFTVNRRTGTIVEGGWGQMLLPIGNLERKDYSFFNIDTNSTNLLEYVGTGEISGLDTYSYRMTLENEFLGQYNASGPVPPTDIHFNGNTTYWFEKRTGIPVAVERDMDLHIKVPNVLKIPDGLVQQRVLIGNATLVDMTDTTQTKDINMMVLFNMTWDLQLGNTLVLWENMTGYDADTGEKLPEVYQLPVYERLISINQNDASHVNEPRMSTAEKYHRRTGQWMFPFGEMNESRTSYSWFNQVTNSTMDCVFQEREYHKGADTFRYRIEAYNYTMKPQDSKLENMIMIFDGYLDYWADVETGIIHDTRIDFTFSVLSVNDPDDFRNKTRLASVDVSMSPESLNESMTNLTQARGFFPHSDKILVVFSGRMELSERSKRELVDMADSLSTQILIGETILPYTCAVLGAVLLFIAGYQKRKRDIFYLK